MDKYIEDIIKNTVNSVSTKELSNALKKCLDLLEAKSILKRELINGLNHVLLYKGGCHKLNSIFKNPSEGLCDIYVHDYKNTPLIYASHMLAQVNRINDYKLRLGKLINFFDNELTEPKTKGLTKDNVLSMFKLMHSKYKIFDIITCKNDLEVFLFLNSHKDYNSLCEVFFEPNKPGTYHNRYILTFASFSEENDPYQVLAHEVGHALQVSLTHDSRVIPESFIEMNKILNVCLKNNTIESTDVFADILLRDRLFCSRLDMMQFSGSVKKWS